MVLTSKASVIDLHDMGFNVVDYFCITSVLVLKFTNVNPVILHPKIDIV